MATIAIDLTAELLHDALQLSEALDQFHLALTGLLRRCIGISGTWTAGCSTGGWKYTGNSRFTAVATRHMLVASNLSTATGYA